MNHSTLRTLAFALALPMLTVIARAQGPADASAKKAQAVETVFGVVDVIAVVEQYPKYIELRKKLEAQIQDYDVQLQEIAQRLDELRGTIQILPESEADKRADLEFQLQMGLQNQDYQRKKFRERMALEDLRNTLTVYEDLEYAITKVATKKGLSFVLSRQDIDPSTTPISELAGREVQKRVNAYDRRQVWYATKKLDVTAEVIKFMQVPLPDRSSPERGGAAPDAGKSPGQGG